jgi:hypothetical protein
VVQRGEFALFAHFQVEKTLVGDTGAGHHVVQRAQSPTPQARVAQEGLVAQVVALVRPGRQANTASSYWVVGMSEVQLVFWVMFVLTDIRMVAKVVVRAL